MNDKWSEEWKHALCNYCDTETSLEGYCTNEDCPVHLLESALEQVQQDAAARRTVNRPCCERCCDQSKEARIDTYIKQLKKKGHSDVEIDAKIKLLEGIL